MLLNVSSAYIEITNICNLDCRSCYNRSGQPHPRKELSLAQIKQIVPRLVGEFGCTSVALAGGEPTLHSEFDEILSYLLSVPQLAVSIVTNGTTLPKNLTLAYRKYPQLKLQISLDGSTEEINALTRGKGNFEKAVSFINELKDAGKTPVMKMVVSARNVQDTEAYYRLAVSLGCDPDFSPINRMGNASEDWDALEPTAKQMLFVLRTIDRLNHEYHKNVILPSCLQKCPFTDESTALSVLIKCDGTMHPCQMLYDEAYSLGNILRDEASELAVRYAEISRLATERINHTDGCKKCLARTQCHRGCMAISVMRQNGPLGDDGACGFRKLQLLDFGVVSK